MNKILTYRIPNELYSLDDSLEKTSTQLYTGPDKIIIWTDKESGRIEQTFIPEDETDAPLPLNIKRHVLTAYKMEDAIKIALLYGGLEKPKVYEINVGLDNQINNTIKDPTDLRFIYNEISIVDDFKAPLKYRVVDRDRSDEFIRDERDAMLSSSDGKISIDMPESLKQQWIDYRQALRDLPVDNLAVPNYLIRFPLDPDIKEDTMFTDENVDVIMIKDRSHDDRKALEQLPGSAS